MGSQAGGRCVTTRKEPFQERVPPTPPHPLRITVPAGEFKKHSESSLPVYAQVSSPPQVWRPPGARGRAPGDLRPRDGRGLSWSRSTSLRPLWGGRVRGSGLAAAGQGKGWLPEPRGARAASGLFRPQSLSPDLLASPGSCTLRLSPAVSAQGASALFDMIEYYESATHLNISFNKHIGTRGWQAAAHMMRKVGAPHPFPLQGPQPVGPGSTSRQRVLGPSFQASEKAVPRGSLLQAHPGPFSPFWHFPSSSTCL